MDTNAERPIKPRPLSPHLSIYKPIPTMVMSIAHRITGVALYIGTAFFVWWILAAASGPDAFATASAFFGSWIGRLILFGYTWVLMHHLVGGLRHFVWDTGQGMDKDFSTKMAYGSVIVSVALTLIIWVIGGLVF